MPINQVILLYLSILIIAPMSVIGQVHLQPPNHGEGLQGLEPDSYVVSWLGAEDAYGYEYVITDNEECFYGCGGDTRQGVAFDTFAIEYNLTPNRDYYWITRVVFNNGEATDWSFPSHFKTIKPESGPFAILMPNPVKDMLRLQLDWSVEPNVRSLDISLYDGSGRPVGKGYQIARPAGVLRYTTWEEPLQGVPPGLYVLSITRDNSPAAPIIRKLMVLPQN